MGISESAGDMKLIFISFDLLTNFALLLCFCDSFVRLDLFGGCWMQCKPPVMLNPSTGAISFFSTLRSVLSTHIIFQVAKFLFSELVSSGAVLRFVWMGSHRLSEAVALERSLPLQGPSVWRFQVFACAIFSNKCVYF